LGDIIALLLCSADDLCGDDDLRDSDDPPAASLFFENKAATSSAFRF
jgi:hypothetical protein